MGTRPESGVQVAVPGVGDLPVELRRVHMVGIGGAGMSGIARLLLSRGGEVSGSDAKESRAVLALRARGAKISIGHSAQALDQLVGGPDVVVTTQAAIPRSNPELVAARERGIPVVLRPAVLASLMAGYRQLLIAGTHGKTSTTSMVVVALQHCALNPSFAVGGELNEAGTNAYAGSGDVFVAEADESDGSLLQYSPNVAVITNVDSDHLDYFGTVDRYVAVFDEFVERISAGGALVVCLDDEGAARLAGRMAERCAARGVAVLGYGAGTFAGLASEVPVVARLLDYAPRADGGVMQVSFSETGSASVESARSVTVSVPGVHMALNALGAIVAAICMGAGPTQVIEGIESYGGVHRRFQLRGVGNGVRVYDDYAHHPTEVAANLAAAQDMTESGGRVIVVFQPHLYSRTASFSVEFAAALDAADEVVVLDVYGAREDPIPGVSGRTIAEKVSRTVHFQPNQSDVPAQVARIAAPGDLVLTMGAGDVTMLGPEILAALRAQ